MLKNTTLFLMQTILSAYSGCKVIETKEIFSPFDDKRLMSYRLSQREHRFIEKISYHLQHIASTKTFFENNKIRLKSEIESLNKNKSVFIRKHFLYILDDFESIQSKFEHILESMSLIDSECISATERFEKLAKLFDFEGPAIENCKDSFNMKIFCNVIHKYLVGNYSEKSDNSSLIIFSNICFHMRNLYHFKFLRYGELIDINNMTGLLRSEFIRNKNK